MVDKEINNTENKKRRTSLDGELTSNDFLNTCKMCKDCGFQNQSHYFKGKCKIYIHSKPESVRLNGDCEFYVKKKD